MSSVKYLTKPISTFHQINAYEEDGFLIVDMCASDDGKAINNYNVQNLRKTGEALDEVKILYCIFLVFFFHFRGVDSLTDSLFIWANNVFRFV